ncbi:hypothetical protein [Alcaligenes endophyticus]|uniref:Uncharacterized protein n=1 Tax=Alcaligenes endophyticus TaxID=1929088 RepID=A0ABT8EKE2_9BURK|nr:hypothetical protein [Alcaligenes endophyticus]MCX5590891.1 hypothetical protein [Alcaligenes endophyticus]MDN4121747.1 hypothetical protein [Alcaligenes endophyticus]
MSNKTFAEVLQDLRYGTLHDELTETLQEVVNACISTGKGGSLTLQIKLKPGKSGELELTDTIKSTVPELEKGASIMWATPEGNLQRQDPRQMTIDGLKSIGKEDYQQLKKV